MGERLAPWSRRIARNLDRMPAAVRADLARWARGVGKKAAARAPRDTSALRGSIEGRFEGSLSRGEVHVASDDPAARALEDGGAIKGSPWLAVPLRDEVRRTGGPRRDGRLFSFRTLDGRIFLASRSSGAVDIRWRLVHTVEVRARPFIRPLVESERKRLPRLLLRSMDREMRRR